MYLQTLTPEEEKYVANPFIHRCFTHPRTGYLLTGVVFITFGCWIIAPAVTWLQPIRDWFFYAEIATALSTFVLDQIPCKCGKTPILSSRQRFAIRQQYRKPSLGKIVMLSILTFGFALIGGVVATSLIVALFKVLQGLLGSIPAVFLLISPVFLAGTYAIYLSAINDEPFWSRGISRRDVERIAELSEDNEDALNKLIEFYLNIGEFEVADAYSRKLLLQAEQ